MSLTYPIAAEFNAHTWEVWIAIYLFLGGVSAGAFVVAAVSQLTGKESHLGLSKIAAFLAPWPVMAGLGALVIDLGKPFSFWLILVNYRLNSVMSIGVILLLVFMPVALLYAYLWWKQPDSALMKPLAWIGIICSVGVGIYTGVLLSSIATNPVWGTSILPALFLVSATSTGVAYVLLGSHFLGKIDARARADWSRIDLGLIGVELVLILLLIIGWVFAPSGAEALREVAGSGYGALFWIGIITLGLLAPLAINIYELKSGHETGSASLALASYALVLFGGFLLRYVILNAGQATNVTF